MPSAFGDRAWAPVRVVILIFAFIVASPIIAAAMDSDELVKQGLVLRRKGDDVAALQKFQQAYEIDKSARSLAQVALAEQALGRWALAYDHLTQALGERSDPWIAKHKPLLEDALKALREHVGRLEILGGSPGAEVRINGTVVGSLPLSRPLTLPIGSAAIEVAAPRFMAIQRTATIRAGQTTRESFDALAPTAEKPTLEPEARVRPVSAVEGSTGDAKPIATAQGSRAQPPASAPSDVTAGEEPSTLRLSAKWVAGGLAVLGIAGGTIAYVSHQNASDDFGRMCYDDPATGIHPLSPPTTEMYCRDLNSTWSSTYTLAVVGFAAGAAFAAAGIVLWLTEPSPSGGSATAFGCSPGAVGPGRFSVGCAIRF